jgi:hypothetical protein
MEVGNPIGNIFHVGNIFQISTDFELIKGFYKIFLNGLWSDRAIEILLQMHQSSILDKDCSMVISKGGL